MLKARETRKGANHAKEAGGELMDHRKYDCDKCRMPSPSVEVPIDVPKEMQTEQGMMLTTYLLMALSIETLQGKNNRLEIENAKLRELVAQMYPKAKAFLQMGVQLGCNDTLSYDWELQMQELRIEVQE